MAGRGWLLLWAACALAQAQATIRGRVVDPAGAPLEGAQVMAAAEKTSTRADGSFSL